MHFLSGRCSTWRAPFVGQIVLLSPPSAVKSPVIYCATLDKNLYFLISCGVRRRVPLLILINLNWINVLILIRSIYVTLNYSYCLRWRLKFKNFANLYMLIIMKRQSLKSHVKKRLILVNVAVINPRYYRMCFRM